jgi:HAD superfamily hydrolase (TIGR01509 family)
MIKAVLWDNDGVLVDTETLFFDITRKAFAELGVTLTKEIWGRRYLSDGRPSREIAAELGADPSRIPRVLEERNQLYRRILAQPAVIRPRVRETLSALTGSVRLAIVTGCDREQLNLVHRSSGLLGFFEVIVTSDDCPHAKPHPELYLTALKALNLSGSDCLAVEDSPRGLASARAAGVTCVVVPTELTAGLNFNGAISIENDVSGVLPKLGVPSTRVETPMDCGHH